MRHQLILLLAVLASSHALSAADKPTEGWLCFLTNQAVADVSTCSKVTGVQIEVEPAEDARRFAWLSGDAKTLVADRLAAGGRAVDLSTERGVVRLMLSASPSRVPPSPMRIDVGAEGDLWKLLLPASASELREIRVPPGEYTFGFRAEHHDRAMRTGVEVGPKAFDLGRIVLEPLPVFSATVERTDGTPLAGAVLIDDAGANVASADHLGRVRFEAECTEETKVCALPERFMIEYPGLAGTRLLIPETKKDFDAGRVILGLGGTLELTILRDSDESFAARVELVEEAREGRPEKPRIIKEAAISPDEDALQVEKLPAGKTALYVRGDEPTQVVSRYVEIKEGEITHEEIEIRPTTLDIRVFLGETPLPSALVTVGVPHGVPDHSVELPPTDDDGRVSTTVWESGMMTAVVYKDEISDVAFFRIGESSSQDVSIRISQTVIRGRIYDAETDEPMRRVSAQHRWTSKEGRKFSSIKTDDEGRFEIVGARPGTHMITVELPDYPPAEASIETTSADVERTLDVPVSPGFEYELEVRGENGRPIPQARVLEVIESGRRYQRWTTDASGDARILMARGSLRNLWIIPVEGSFAFTTVSAEDRTSAVLVPDPTGALVVRTVDEEGKPAPSSHLGIRYRGRLIEHNVAGTIARIQGVRLRTGSDGSTALRGFPPGEYEIWAIQYDGDDLVVGEPGDLKVESFYYPGGQQAVTVEAGMFPSRPE